MSTHDTSGHERRAASEGVTSSLENGSSSSNDSMEFPQAHSLKHGEKTYTPTTVDPEYTDSKGTPNC